MSQSEEEIVKEWFLFFAALLYLLRWSSRL